MLHSFFNSIWFLNYKYWACARHCRHTDPPPPHIIIFHKQTFFHKSSSSLPSPLSLLTKRFFIFQAKGNKYIIHIGSLRMVAKAYSSGCWQLICKDIMPELKMGGHYLLFCHIQLVLIQANLANFPLNLNNFG